MHLFYIKAYSFKNNAYLRFLVAERTEDDAREHVEQYLTGDYKVERISFTDFNLAPVQQPYVQEI